MPNGRECAHMWFRRQQQPSDNHEDTSTQLALDVSSLESTEGRKSLSSRALINALTLATVLALLVASVPLWIGSVGQAWAHLFPPPAYTGTLLFTEAGSQLTALRTTDGGVQWSLSMDLQNSNVFRYNDALYVAQYTENQILTIEAIRARDGHVLWQSRRQGYNVPEVIGIRGAYLYALYEDGPTGKEMLIALDVHTGQLRWATAEMTSAEVFLADNNLILCQYDISADGQTALYGLTALDGSTGKQHWGYTLSLKQSDQSSGYACGTTATQAVIVLDPGATGALYAYNVQTGTLSWHTQVGPSVEIFDQHMVYLTTWTGSGSISSNTATGDSLRALRADDGGVLWTIPGQYFPPQQESLTFPDILLAHTPNGLAGLDPKTGMVRWTWTPAAASASDGNFFSGSGNVLFYNDQTGIYAFDARSGKMLWQRSTQSALSSTATQYQRLYISAQQHILALNANDGRLRWQTPIEEITHFVYCLTCNG
jgi:outer membrane protein assembly factor BamB